MLGLSGALARESICTKHVFGWLPSLVPVLLQVGSELPRQLGRATLIHHFLDRSGKISFMDMAPLGNASTLPVTAIPGSSLYWCRECKQMHSLTPRQAAGQDAQAQQAASATDMGIYHPATVAEQQQAPQDQEQQQQAAAAQMSHSAAARAEPPLYHFYERQQGAHPRSGSPIAKYGGTSPHSSGSAREFLFDTVASPKRIVRELNKYVVGQHHAKKLMAVAGRSGMCTSRAV